jgi:hypothetical protein
MELSIVSNAGDKSSISNTASIADINTWMKINLLKLNQDKTELIIFAPKHRVKELGNCQIVLHGKIL